MFLLDSKLLSELRSAKRCDPSVKSWQQAHPLAICRISVITLLEIRRGIEQVGRKDAPFAAILNEWLEGKVKPAFAGRVLAVTPAVAERRRRLDPWFGGLPDCRHSAGTPPDSGDAQCD